MELRPRSRRTPRRPIRASDWARVLWEVPARPVLDHSARIRLAGLMAAALNAEFPERLVEEPEVAIDWWEAFSPAPFFAWVPCEALEFGLCWTTAVDELEQHLEDWRWDELWEEALAVQVERLDISPDRVSFTIYSTVDDAVVVRAGSVEIAAGEVDEDLLVAVVQAQTGWICHDRGQVIREPVRCADCGLGYLLDHHQDDCPRCGSEIITVGWDEERPPPALPGEAVRLTALLVELGLIEVVGAVEAVHDAIRGALAEACVLPALTEALLTCPAVGELYASDATIAAVLSRW